MPIDRNDVKRPPKYRTTSVEGIYPLRHLKQTTAVMESKAKQQVKTIKVEFNLMLDGVSAEAPKVLNIPESTFINIFILITYNCVFCPGSCFKLVSANTYKVIISTDLNSSDNHLITGRGQVGKITISSHWGIIN